MTRFGALVERVDQKLPGADLPLLSVSQTRGVIRRSELTDTPARADSLDHYKTCQPGDIVFNKMSIRAGAMGQAEEAGLVTYHYEVMRPRPRVDPRYVVYLMKSSWFTAEMVRRERGIAAGDGSGSVRTTEVPFRVLKTIDVPIPIPDEQRAIADFLDRETAQIDAFIAKNEELISLLTERSAAAIDECFSRVPTEALLTIRRVLKVAQTGPFGTQLSASEYVSDGVPVINPTHVVGGSIQPDAEVSVSVSRAETMTRFRLRTGDIVLGRKGEVDKSAIVTRAFDGAICGSDSMMLRPNARVTAEYLWTFLQSPSAHSQLERFSVGSTVAGLNQQTLRSVRLPVPPADEQAGVVEALKLVTGRVDQAILTATRSIELARERRAALISAAVTGKIDVGVSA